jgi:hypothetical protein
MDILEMCRVWIEYMTLARRTAWGVPQEEYNELTELYDAARELLYKVMDKAERTHVITVECQAAFKALTVKMRFVKDRRLKIPPLSLGDLTAMGLKQKDPPTPTGNPKAQVMVETYLLGRHELGLKIVYVSGDPKDRANKGYRIWYKVVPPGGEPVTSPKQLDESFYTKRKKDVLQFDYEDSGKTVYIAVQVENDGKKGDWGPLISAVIP